jgi:hypothetical protein
MQTNYDTTMGIGIEGQLADTGNHEVVSYANGEASATMPPGCAVKFGVLDQEVLKLTATSSKVAGIVIHSHRYDPDTQLDADGAIKANNMLGVLRKGRILVKCEEGCAPGDPLFIRAVVAGAERMGALRMSADSTDCIDATAWGTWLTTAAAGGLAWLEVDFTSRSSNIGS